jgi:hypothetical protein
MADPTPNRFTLRDLPLPAKLVVTTFLISVGLGYLWAMAQIHFKHASPGHTLPTTTDLVARFSGVPWPLEPKPEIDAAEKKADHIAQGEAVANAVKIKGVKIKSLIGDRCAICHSNGGEKEEFPLDTYDGIAKYLAKSANHPHGHMHTAITADRTAKWGKENMVPAFFEKSDGWRQATKTRESRQKLEAEREAERLALVAWIEAGARKAQYDADAFPLPTPEKFDQLTKEFVTEAVALPDRPSVGADNPVDRWKAAKRKQLSPDALTQSTHAHLLTFSLLWAATGVIFAFTSYSLSTRCILSPLVLIAQIVDVACWWLARLEPPAGPYFALAIMGTGAIVGMGLGAQILLSLFNMYGRKGRLILAIFFLAGAGLFVVTYAKVIGPQLQAEEKFAEQNAK